PWALSLALRFHADIALNADGDVVEAERLFGLALEAAEASGGRGAIARTLLFAGWTDWTRERYDEAIVTWRRALDLAREHGDRWELADALSDRGNAYRELGRLDEAEADLQLSVRISEELGERSLLPWTWRALAKVAQRRGDPEAAQERLRRAEEAEPGQHVE